jgi:aldose 1-epimerase
MGIEKRPYGTLPDGRAVSLYKLASNEVEAQVTNYGGIITTMRVPDSKGEWGDIVHGFDALDEYLHGHPYFGCIVGRYANRIGGAIFGLDGREYQVAKNSGKNSLHGGLIGFDKVLWHTETKDSQLKLNYLSVDGEEGYPGNLQTTVTYSLKGGDFSIDYEAKTDKPTVLNLTNHTYFNLNCGGDVNRHELTLDADYYTPTGRDLIPTGEIKNVAGTPLDFRQPYIIGGRIESRHEQIINGGGYDCNWIINGEPGKLRRAATVRDPVSGRVLVVFTTQPGIQFYTGNFLDGTIRGKGRVYTRRSGLCLETQHYPDSPNTADFPSTVLRPGELYCEKTVFRFHVG